jgi:hypothetical protein
VLWPAILLRAVSTVCEVRPGRGPLARGKRSSILPPTLFQKKVEKHMTMPGM